MIARIKELQKSESSFSIKPLRIAFAGAEKNTGTTFISLLFAGYLNSIGRKCTYVEANDSGAWYSLSGPVSDNRALAGLDTLSRKSYESSPPDDGDIILDYGCLTKDMPEEFYGSDIVCITLGNRCWEAGEAVKARALSRRCSKRVFLVTPASVISIFLADALEGEKYLAFPFTSSADEILKDTEVKTVLHEIAVYAGIIIE